MSGETNGSAERTSLTINRGTRELLEKCKESEWEPLDSVVKRAAKALLASMRKNHNGA